MALKLDKEYAGVIYSPQREEIYSNGRYFMCYEIVRFAACTPQGGPGAGADFLRNREPGNH